MRFHAKFFRCGFENVRLKPSKSQKFVIFVIYLAKRGISPEAIFTKFDVGEGSQVPTVVRTFTIVALKMWLYGCQNRQK